MYSILIKSGNNTFVFATDETTGDVYTGNLGETKSKFAELLQKYPISKLAVVHNTTVTNDMTIEDVAS